MFNLIPSPVKLAHLLMSERLLSGGVAVDATVGNGYDTLFLAKAVGPTGRVYGFDIQQKALKETVLKLQTEGCMDWVTLFEMGHENLGEKVRDPVDGIMFNLGYLPGGSHDIITKPDTTIRAIYKGLELLKPGGLLTVVVYPGHAGGSEEAREIDNILAVLPKNGYSCLKSSFLNRSQSSPYLITVEKKMAG